MLAGADEAGLAPLPPLLFPAWCLEAPGEAPHLLPLVLHSPPLLVLGTTVCLGHGAVDLRDPLQEARRCVRSLVTPYLAPGAPQAMVLDTKLNKMQHSAGQLEKLFAGHRHWAAHPNARHDFRGPNKPYKRL